MRLLYLQLLLDQDHFLQHLHSRQLKQVQKLALCATLSACLVDNNITFFIAAPSGFPQDFSASVVTSRSLSLIWNPPPLEDQNGVIIHYRINITVLDSMEMFQLLSDNSSITVNSLIPYTTYMLTIAAETAVCEGPFSGAYTVMTATDGKKQTPYIFIFIDWTYVHKSENCIYTGDC